MPPRRSAWKRFAKRSPRCREEAQRAEAGWLNQKNAIDHVQELKSELDDARGEEERATRDGDLARASELRYAKIPQLEQEIKAAEDELAAQRERDGAG